MKDDPSDLSHDESHEPQSELSSPVTPVYVPIGTDRQRYINKAYWVQKCTFGIRMFCHSKLFYV